MRHYPLFKVHVDVEKALTQVRDALESGYLNEGTQVALLTEKLATYLDTTNVVLMNSCTSAITVALRLAGVCEGSTVISTPMTCVATNTPILNLGARVLWADIDPTTGCIDPLSIESLLDSESSVDAVVGVNWAGMPIDSPKISKICDEHGILFIQDAAQSFGAMIDGRHTHEFSDFTCYSLQAIKHITTGDGGILVCKDNDDNARAKALKWFGIDRDAAKDAHGNWKGQHWDFDIEEAGYKFNMNNVAAAIGLSQVEYINVILAKHRRNAALIQQMLEHTSIKPLTPLGNPAYWVFTVLLENGKRRDDVLRALNDDGINASLLHVPNHTYSCFKNSYRNLPGVNEFFSRQVTLPCGWWLNDDDVAYIAERLIFHARMA